MNACHEAAGRRQHTMLPVGTHRLRCTTCGRNDRDKTMGVTVGADGAVWHCFRCGVAGAQHHDRQYFRPSPIRTKATAPKLDWSSTADAIWRRTAALHGTQGEVYLRARGCAMPPSDSHVRFLPPDGRHPPTLCAAITDAISGKPISLHFTKLAPDGRGKAGTDRDKTMLAGHRKAGGVIRLWPDEAVTTGLAVAEGMETALAAAHAYTPVWACVDAGNLTAFPVLPGIECLTVLADHDEPGIRAADWCGYRWEAAGREVLIVMPNQEGTDMADVVAA